MSIDTLSNHLMILLNESEIEQKILILKKHINIGQTKKEEIVVIN